MYCQATWTKLAIGSSLIETQLERSQFVISKSILIILHNVKLSKYPLSRQRHFTGICILSHQCIIVHSNLFFFVFSNFHIFRKQSTSKHFYFFYFLYHINNFLLLFILLYIILLFLLFYTNSFYFISYLSLFTN